MKNIISENELNPTNSTISNAVALAKSTLFGVSHLVKLKLVVEGRIIPYHKSFELTQTTQGHHEFKLVLSHDSLGVTETYQMEEAQKLLGKRLLVSFQFKNIIDKPERNFYGVITQVSFEQEHGSQGLIVLHGYSPTILLDGATHTQSFGGDKPIDISAIVDQVLRQGLGEGKYEYTIKLTKPIGVSYVSQYNETHYNFLLRLAAMYDQHFFYDGKQICFGELPKGEKPLDLIYGRDVSNINISMQIKHVKRNFYGYNSFEHKPLTPTYGSQVQHQGSLAKDAYKISENTFLTPSLQVAPLKASTDTDITSIQKGVIGNDGAQVFVTTGSTSIPFLYPGCVVDLNMTLPGLKTSNYFTQIMITEVVHHVDTLGRYKGVFKAVAALSGYLPQDKFTMPIAEPQFAEVISNTDPDGKGRVQVRFPWQPNDANTEFIRVLTPDAGSSDKVNKNRGLVFIPEKGDQVMVGFVHNHPDRPYVMGGLFHGKIANGGGEQNHLKTIITRSGCTIQLDDTDSQGSVTIKDPSGNTWYMDGAGNINVTAPKNIVLTAGEDLVINVGNDMKTNVTNDNSISVGNSNSVDIVNDHTFTSKNYKQIVNQDKTITITGHLNETTSTTTHKAENGDIVFQSSGIAKLLGKIDAKVNKG